MRTTYEPLKGCDPGGQLLRKLARDVSPVGQYSARLRTTLEAGATDGVNR